MKLLLDEMFSAEIAVQLRRRGHDVLAVNERGDLRELPDPDLFQAAQAEQRILVTENGSHFLRLDRTYRQQGESHHGLILTTHHPSTAAGRAASASSSWPWTHSCERARAGRQATARSTGCADGSLGAGAPPAARYSPN